MIQQVTDNPGGAASCSLRTAGRVLAVADDVRGTLENRLAPAIELALRLWLASIFLVSGIIKLADWDKALWLATNEYPVSWMSPALAASLGVTIEVVCPVFLALGLMTRLAAIPMAVLTLVIQYNYLALTQQQFWAMFLVWFAVMGAGPLSLDAVLRRGVVTSALPLIGPLVRIADQLTRLGEPLIKLAMRLWMASIFFASGLTKLRDWDATVFLFREEYAVPLLPTELAAYLATTFELAMPVLLVVGLCTRLATLPLLAMTAVIQFTYLHHVDHLWWAATLALILARGPGALSLDHVLWPRLRSMLPFNTEMPVWTTDAAPHVVIVGAGFGGVAAARGLRRSPCRVTLIDRHNYHLFQPLLYQVATAGLSPADIATPIRELFRDQDNCRVLLGRVTGVDTGGRAVLLGEQPIAYDHLILATGARHSYFGKDEWEPLAPGLKKIEDATAIRRRLLVAFEAAENATDPAERAAQLTFVLVGAGPTGVELAGAMAELARNGMAHEFRTIDPASARVILVQSAPRILPTFPEELSRLAQVQLESLGVEIRLDGKVTAIDEHGVMVGDEHIPARTVIWAAGVVASPAGKWVGADQDRSGRATVGPDLSVAGHPEIFVVGDTAASNGWDGQPVPGLAPAAKQAGAHAASVIHARLTGQVAPGPFRYRHAGSLATIGRRAAVADFGWLKLSGPLAWWLWGAAHVLFLVGTRNRLSVMLSWFWAYLTYRRSTRLITG